MPRATSKPSVSVIVVSANSAQWLPPCLESVLEHAGSIDLDLVVVDSGSTDDTEAVASSYPSVRVLSCENHGFAHANNVALTESAADWMLFLNPDTQVLEGTISDLVAGVAARSEIGLVGVRQVTPDGRLFPTARRFPTPLRMTCEALASERWPFHASWSGERVLELGSYEHEFACDWVSGSCMLARREAVLSVGLMDERFFLFSEEVDFCLRVRQAGWEIRHVPWLTVLHHFGKAGVDARLVAQEALSRRLYLQKHFPPLARVAATAALGLGYGIRAVVGAADGDRPARRAAARGALATLAGRRAPPFGKPPRQAFLGRHRA